MIRQFITTMTLLLVCHPHLLGQTAGPFRFQDVHLGMSLAEFVAKHPAPKADGGYLQPSKLQQPGEAVCSTSATLTNCQFQSRYLRVRLRVMTVFVNTQLVMIEVEPPADSEACFEPPPTSGSALAFYYSLCTDYPPLFQALTGTLGAATILVSSKAQELHAMRWENDTSVAEFQLHLCGPWIKTGWKGNYQEILEGRYCGEGDDLSYSQPVMMYFQKG